MNKKNHFLPLLFLNFFDMLNEVTEKVHEQLHLQHYKMKSFYCHSLSALHAFLEHLLKK